MANTNQLSELATIYNQLPAHKQKQTREFIKLVTDKSRATIWLWCTGKRRIPYNGIETQIINYMKGLLK